MVDDLFIMRFMDCHFNEVVFLSLGGDKNVNIKSERHELSWSVLTLSHNDPLTVERGIEVCKIIDLQKVAYFLHDVFLDLDTVTRSHILIANVLARIEVLKKGFNLKVTAVAVPKGGSAAGAATNNGGIVVQVVAPLRKCGRPLRSKDVCPRKRAAMHKIIL